MSGYGLTYKLTMCYPNFIASKFVASSMFMNNNKKKKSFSLEIVLLTKKNPHYLSS